MGAPESEGRHDDIGTLDDVRERTVIQEIVDHDGLKVFGWLEIRRRPEHRTDMVAAFSCKIDEMFSDTTGCAKNCHSH
jgi:hypothetical protein